VSEDLVPVWIMGDEYECPEHYQWTEGPLSDSYREYLYMVPREQAERWQEVQEAFLQMNREMKVLRQERARQSVMRNWAKGLPW
jgi:hypothetical protein